MWDSKGKAQDTKAVIPDSSYAEYLYETIKFLQKNMVPLTQLLMGTVPEYRLMAQKAERNTGHIDKKLLKFKQR